MNERIRILIAAHSPHRGGAEYCLDTTLRHLDRDRFEPLVVFPDEGPMVDAVRGLGVEVLVRPMCHWLYFKKGAWYWRNLVGRGPGNVLGLARLMRRRGIDLVYTNTSAIFEPAMAARRARLPHVWHVHEVLADGTRMDQLLPLPLTKRLVYRWSDRIVFESHAARRVFERTAPADKSCVVHNSLRLEADESTDRWTTRSDLGFGPDDVVIGCVGQFIDRKNPDLLVESLRRIDSPKAKALFVGEGPLEEGLRSKVIEAGLEHRCRILPFQTDVRPVMSAIDLLALPSRQESFGLVLVEAGFYGKPVVACRSQGPEEIVEDGRTGYLVDQDDTAEFAGALGRLVESAEHRNALGSEARVRVNDTFHPARNTRRLEEILESAMGERGTSKGPESGFGKEFCKS